MSLSTDIHDIRRCAKCGEVKAVTEFSVGWYRCKPCRQDDLLLYKMRLRNRAINELLRWPRPGRGLLRKVLHDL